MKMTPAAIVIGSLAILSTIVFMIVYMPWATRIDTPSDIYRARTAIEEKGRKIYIANGCVYCHSQAIRR
jgi:cbb3-type cytochrome oxidase cytochrome c subunit